MAAWFELVLSLAACEWLQHCVPGCVWVHSSALDKEEACVCVRDHMQVSTCVCIYVQCVLDACAMNILCSTQYSWGRTMERSKERGGHREGGDQGMMGDLNHRITTYGYSGHNALLIWLWAPWWAWLPAPPALYRIKQGKRHLLPLIHIDNILKFCSTT